MENIVIIGAGGFGRELKCLLDDINKTKPTYNLLGFYDDNIAKHTKINGLEVLGTLQDLNNIEQKCNVVLGIGVPTTKLKIVELLTNKHIHFPNLIHPNVVISKDDVTFGIGNIICAGNIITCNIQFKDFVTLNLSCTVGHDTKIESFSSFMPSVNISGDVKIGKGVYVGTGAKIINNLSIGSHTIVGAGAVVAITLPENCTAVGIPAKPIKFH